MYCRLCDIEYPKSLRFCKWCGGGLVSREAVGSQHCPACGSSIEREWLFCNECGVDLATLGAQPRDLPCPSCSAPVQKGWMFCRQCGEQIATERAGHRCAGCGAGVRGSWYFCKQCGAGIKSGAPQPASPDFRTVAGMPALPPEADAPFSDLNSGELPHLDDVITSEKRAGAPPGGAPPVTPAGRAAGIHGGTKPLAASRSTGQLDENQLEREFDDQSRETVPPGHSSVGRLEASELIHERSATLVEPIEAVPPPSPPMQATQVYGAVQEPAPPVQPPPPAYPQMPTPTIAITPAAANPPTVELPPAPSLEPPVAPVSYPPPPVQSYPPPQYPAYDTPPAGYAPQPPGPPAATQSPGASGSSAIKWLMLAAGVVVLLLVAAVVAVVLWQRSGPATPTEVTTTPVVESPTTEPAPPVATTPATPVPPPGMVYVAGGSFSAGSDDAGADAYSKPAHPIAVKPFFIDVHEVTNGDYKAFVDATGHAPPSKGWSGGAPAPGTERLPVVYVSWEDATAYAKWAGKRLPTEQEWEFAARGADGRAYPWGNQFDTSKGNLGKAIDQPTAVETAKLSPVGSFASGASPFGALDMVGNVWEWTASSFSLYPGGDSSLKRYDNYKVIRGGAYDNKGENTAMYRGFYPASDALPRVGFRCARDLN